MARPLRVEYPGAYYHVINRGNAGEIIFPSNEDKEKFLDYLARAVEQFDIVIHTYCVMSNHYHLLMETPHANLSSAIQWLSVSYAVSYNRRRGRRGHLFGGRFKALLIDAEEYLTHLSRYIHLNPVRARIVKRADDYPWSSYPALVGRVKSPGWLYTEGLLSYFAGNKKDAIKQYKEYVKDADVEGIENPREQAVGGFILGGEDFVKRIQEIYLVHRKDEREIPQLRAVKPRIGVETILEAVCEEFDCDEEQILVRGRKRNTARDISISLSRTYSGMLCKDLGKEFGGITGAAITLRCNELSKKLARNKGLREKIQRIENRILNN